MQKLNFSLFLASFMLLLVPQKGMSQAPSIQSEPDEDNLETNFTRNIISFHLLDVAYNDFTFSYERLSKNGRFGFRFPVSIGYNSSDYEDFKNLYYFGTGLNIYITGQGKFRYFMGPHLRIGRAESTLSIYEEFDPYVIQKKYEFPYFKFYVDNGIAYTPVRNYTLSAILSLGVKYFDKEPVKDSGLTNSAHFTFCMSYRF